MKIKPLIGKLIIASVVIGEIAFFCTLPLFVIACFITLIIVIILFTWLLSWLFKEDEPKNDETNPMTDIQEEKCRKYH